VSFVFVLVLVLSIRTGVLGYLGETSIQSSALMYGNWIHTEHVFQAGGIANNHPGAAQPRNAMVTTLWQDWATANANPPTSYASGTPDGSVPGMTIMIGKVENFALAADFLGLTVDSWDDMADPGGQGDVFYNTWMKVRANGLPRAMLPSFTTIWVDVLV
jgi:hypothetical protein